MFLCYFNSVIFARIYYDNIITPFKELKKMEDYFLHLVLITILIWSSDIGFFAFNNHTFSQGWYSSCLKISFL